MQPRFHTTNYDDASFTELYMHAAGLSEIPLVYHQWCSLFTIAACVSDRVWVEKFKHLSPNLYVILLGPSGLGKGGAMSFSESLLRSVEPELNIWTGQITAPKLVDKLGKPTKDNRGRKVVAKGQITLFTPEMATSIGMGYMADKFVKLMTALYEGHTNWDEGTRTSGDVEVKDCNINWIAGTTQPWMIECLPKSSIDSGFLARSVITRAEYDFTKRVAVPERPQDFDEIYLQLRTRCLMYASLRGEFEFSNQASDMHLKWYNTRPDPEHDTAVEAAWKRDDDLCLKLAMILSLGESIDMRVEARHMTAAQRLITKAHKDLPALLTMANQTPETEVIGIVRDYVKQAGRITHRSLMQKLGAKGKKSAFVKDAVTQLKVMYGEIEFERGPRGGVIYSWRG